MIEGLSSLLKTCIANKSLSRGKLIHQKILSLGLCDNIFLSKSLINFYFSCHSYDSAKLVFQTTTSDIILCNSLIAAYAKNSMFVDALDLFHNIAPLRPDFYTYPSVLKACGELRRIHDGETLHAQLVKLGLMSDVAISSSVVRVYAKCSMFDSATKLFDEMTERDVACWNTLISCYYQGGRAGEALGLFEKMKKAATAAASSGGYPQPNAITFTIAISSCAKTLDLERGRAIHKELESSGLRFDDFISSALVDMYGQCGDLEMAKSIFEQITRKNIVAWNAMISGFALEGDSVSCVKMLERMKREGIEPSSTTLTSVVTAAARSGKLQHGQLIHGYIIRRRNDEDDIILNCSLISFYFKCGRVKFAENVFRTMQQKTSINPWNVMISGHVAVGNYCEAIEMYEEMKSVGTVRSDAVTFSNVLAACAQLASLEKGKEIHQQIIFVDDDDDTENNILMGSVLDMYAKCGAVDDAYYVFKKQVEKKSSCRDVKLWTSMINAYGAHGRGREALELFWSMRQRNIEPDKVVFLAVLSACSHAGLVDEGCLIFSQMVGIRPEREHYLCLIDLLGRAGRLHEAYKIIQLYQAEIMGGDIEFLSTLLSACCFHHNEELGDEIASAITQLDDDPSIMLSNVYASVKRWDEVRDVRWKMKELGLRKNHPGCSWIEIHQEIHSFLVQDKSHPMAEALYHSLHTLSSHMMDHNDKHVNCCCLLLASGHTKYQVINTNNVYFI